MFKWHVHSAIGRGRPVGKDFSRVTDGIATSLRAFSASASRTEERGSRAPSARQRSAVAVQELSSFKPAPQKGVDARALAAKPPTFKITRYASDSHLSAALGSIGGTRGVARPGPRRGGGGGGGRKRSIDDDDDDDYGDNFRPRSSGGMRGGRGRGGRRFSSMDPSEMLDATNNKEDIDPAEKGRKPWEVEAEDDYTDEEVDYINMSVGGGNRVYDPETSLENLQRWRPAVIHSPTGIMENVRYRLAVATDNHHPQYRPSGDHNMRVNRGLGTLFEDIHQRAILQEWKDGKELSNAIEWGKNWYQEDFGELNKEQKNEVMKQWVAGHYEAPKPPGESQDVLSYVRSYMQKNETFLSRDKQKMEEKLKQFLPAQFLRESQTTKKAPARA